MLFMPLTHQLGVVGRRVEFIKKGMKEEEERGRASELRFFVSWRQKCACGAMGFELFLSSRCAWLVSIYSQRVLSASKQNRRRILCYEFADASSTNRPR